MSFIGAEVQQETTAPPPEKNPGSAPDKYMFGYRKYHGCPTALLSLTEQWKEDLDKHNIIGTIAIDLSKAFDCLSHDFILEKLKFYGLSDLALSLMRSYLSSRCQRVNLSDTFYTCKKCHTGLYVRTYII